MEKFPSQSEQGIEAVSEKKRSLIERLGKLVKQNKGVAMIVLAFEMSLGTSLWLEDYGRSSPKTIPAVETMASILEKSEGHLPTSAERQLADKLEEEIGQGSLIGIESLDSVKTDAERARYIAENDKGSLRVEGFENSIVYGRGASNEDMRAVIESMPKMYQVHAPAVRYEDKEDEEGLEKYGLSKNKFATIAYNVPSKNEIVFTGEVKGMFTLAVETILHEEAHSKDWSTNKALTLDERMELAQEVINRVNAPNRYRSSYVESINNPDLKKNLRIKAEEYYAELTEAYFLPDKYKLLSQKDKDIIERVIHKTDPSFKEVDREKVSHAISKRERIHDEIEMKEYLRNPDASNAESKEFIKFLDKK